MEVPPAQSAGTQASHSSLTAGSQPHSTPWGGPRGSRSIVSDDDHTRQSGSRWEPGPAEHVAPEPATPDSTRPDVTPSGTTPPEADATAEAHAHPAGTPEPETTQIPMAPAWSALPPSPPAPPPARRRSRRRAGLFAAAAAAGLLAVGGLGGYAIGSAAGDTGPAAAGAAGGPGGSAHHRGPLGRDGGLARDGR